MADEFTYINYSVEDIERYLGGRMNAKDMHDMERAALQDPFLADAIEGLQQQPFAQTYQHLDDIAIAIQGEKEPAKVVVLPVKRNYWWRVAAIIGFVVIASAALWYGRSSNVVKNKAVSALVPEKPQPAQAPAPKKVETGDTIRELNTTNFKKRAIATQPSVITSSRQLQGSKQANLRHNPATVVLGYAAVKTDSIASPAAPPVAKANTNAIDLLQKLPELTVDIRGNINSDTVLYKKLQGYAAGVNVNNYNNNAITNIKRSGPTDNEANVMTNNTSNNVLFKNVLINNKAFATAPSIFEGFVIDDKKQPVANVTIYSDDKKHVTLTDSKGYFILNTGDSQLAVQVASAGYYPKQAQLKPSIPSYITINQQASTLSEVVVTEFKNAHLTKKMTADSLFPEGGWQSFREYVYKKLHKEKDMDTSGAVITMLSKSVEIEFVVDENGLAKDLKITKSLNGDSDAKALEVVQQWPHWIATRKDRKGKVVIQF